MDEQLINDSIIVVGFFSALLFIFIAAYTTALAWFKITSRIDSMDSNIQAMDDRIKALGVLAQQTSENFSEFITMQKDMNTMLSGAVSDLQKSVDKHS
ncbi:MAG: hypothetical protein ACON31_09485 [Candidatus Puniceispirillaceae bacterium]